MSSLDFPLDLREGADDASGLLRRGVGLRELSALVHDRCADVDCCGCSRLGNVGRPALRCRCCSRRSAGLGDKGVERLAVGGADRRVGAEYCVVAGQAAFRYSWMSPSHRVDLMTRRWGVPASDEERAAVVVAG